MLHLICPDPDYASRIRTGKSRITTASRRKHIPAGVLTNAVLAKELNISFPDRETSMQMLNPHCGVDRDSRGVVRLTICNAGPLNILGSEAIAGIRQGLEALGPDLQIRALVLAGESPRSMIGGADIKEMAGLDQASAERFISGFSDLCEALRAFPAPVIARIPGWCLGGGLEVAAACDFRIAAYDAKFGMPEVRVGIPSVIHAALLPRLIGSGRARWLVMTAENIDAATALAWGLVDVVAPENGLDAAVEKTVDALLKCGPEALRAQKRLLRQWEELPLTESINLSIGVFGQSFLTDEPRRLMQAFIDRKR
jgi:enoyl-CoA hydratase